MDVIDAVLGTYPSWSHLVVRVGLGVVFFAHGAQKVFGWFGGAGLRATVAGFARMGIPAPAATAAALVELLGGLAMLVGLLVRPAAVGLIVVMLVAMLTVHRQHGFFMNWFGNQSGEGYEYHVLALGVAAALVIGGAGRWSVDALIAR